MRKLFLYPLSFLLILTLFASGCAAQNDALNEAHCPFLTDPVDLYMQRLAIMSQQDEAIGSLPYHQETIEKRGCAPLSIANPLIAAFGVTDRETAADLVYEVMAVLTPKRQYRRKPVSVERIARVLHQADRAESTGDFPQLARYVGMHPGEIRVTDDDLTAPQTAAALADNPPSMLVGRMYVQESWEEAVRVAYTLHEAGYDNALLMLGYAGAGTANTGAPLRSGDSGHYLSVCLHVGTFVSNGSLYVLDSLPRALSGEAFGPDLLFHVPYRFTEDEGAFRLSFTASRISPTVIRLSLRHVKLHRLTAMQQQAFDSSTARTQALIALQTELLTPLKLYGRCLAILSLPGIPL